MAEDGGGAASRVAVPGAVEVLRVPLGPADGFPNNPKLPLFVYKVSHRWLEVVLVAGTWCTFESPRT